MREFKAERTYNFSVREFNTHEFKAERKPVLREF